MVATPLVAYRLYKLLVFYGQYRKLRAQGIPAVSGRYNILKDLIGLDAISKENPNALEMSALCRRTMNVEALPPATIFSMFGRPLLLINSAEYLQDIYVNKN